MRALHTQSNRIRSALALAIILLAFVLRVYHLDVQSFAFDEGWTSYAIHHSWTGLWRVLAPDNHPPLYYVLTKAFADVAGYGDFPVRFVSVVCGTALVAALYVLGHRLAGSPGGLVAALWSACSPLFCYYAQEARMYSLLMLLGTLASYSLVRWLQEEGRAWYWAYVLLAAGTLYTHYFGVLLLVAHNVVALVWLLSQRRVHAAGRWLLGQGCAALLFLPWLPIAIDQVRIGQGTWWRVPLPARVVARDMWRFFVLGPRRPEGVAIVGTILGGTTLAAAVAVVLGWRRGWRQWVVALAVLMIPFGLMVFAGSTWPVYTDRYALIAAPGVALVVGLGAAACWQGLSAHRWVGRVTAILVAGAAVLGPLPSLHAAYTDPRYWREDFRRAAEYVMASTGAGDTVVLVGAYQPIMQYYDGEAEVVWFPQQGDSVESEEQVVDAFSQAIRPDSQVRLVSHSWQTVDPQGLVEGLLRARCRVQGEHWQRETGQRPIKVLNLEECAPFEVEPRVAVDALFGDQVALSAYRLSPIEAGKQAQVFLWWRTLRRPDRDYSAFVHLVSADGAIVTQLDHLPLSDFYPMRSWPVGEEQRDSYLLEVPPDADLEGAWLAVGLYERKTVVRLPVQVGGAPAGDIIRIELD